MAGNLSELESAIQTLVEVFDKYAGKDLLGRKCGAISKSKFRKLLSCELNHMLTATENKKAANTLIAKLDEDSDGKISFEEYWHLIGEIIVKFL